LKHKKILYTAGTNDPLFPPVSNTVFTPHMSEHVRILLVPNTGHTAAGQRQLTAWQMWLAYCFAGRDIPTAEVTAQHDGDVAVVTAKVWSSNAVQSVRVWSTHDKTGAYLGATWKKTELERVDNGEYRGTIEAPQEDYTAYFIEVADQDPASVPGLVTSGMSEFVGARTTMTNTSN
jgi:PhoPQ-activated pathogenicity-related protein